MASNPRPIDETDCALLARLRRLFCSIAIDQDGKTDYKHCERAAACAEIFSTRALRIDLIWCDVELNTCNSILRWGLMSHILLQCVRVYDHVS